MAIKSQCEQCKHYSSDHTPCGPTGAAPYYNSYSCEHYSRRIVLDKPSDRQQSTAPLQPPLPPPSGNTQPNPGTPKRMFSAVFSFDGRIRRLEYGLTFIAYMFMSFILALLSEAELYILWLIFYVPVMWILYAQGAKRCHDMGYNGWWQIVPFFFLVMIFGKQEPQINQYGAPAK